MIEQAKAFAKRLKAEAGDDIDAKVRYAFTLAFSRPVSDVELKLANQYLAVGSHDTEKDKNTMDRWERYAHVLLGSNEFMYLD
jgi:sporulation-control protein spo0M